MTTDTKPDPLSWLRAEARFPSRKADGVAATETLAYVARLQAQVDALAGALLEQKRADAYTVAYRHLPEAAEQIAEAQEGAIRMREAALAAAGR